MRVAQLQVGQMFWWNGNQYKVVRISNAYQLYGGMFRDITTESRMITLPVEKIIG